jgi:hypothetical protein
MGCRAEGVTRAKGALGRGRDNYEKCGWSGRAGLRNEGAVVDWLPPYTAGPRGRLSSPPSLIRAKGFRLW